MKISIIIPAYNEENRIGKTLWRYSEFFEHIRKSKKIDYEILVVINNTKDRTEDIVKAYQRKNNRIHYLNLVKGGKGYAVIEGFKEALKNKSTTHIGFVDADMATPAESFFRLFKEMGNFDATIASRYLKSSTLIPPHTFRRLVMAKAFNFIVRILFLMPYTDTQCGAKLFTRKAAKIITEEVRLSQWAFDVEILFKLNKKGMKIRQVPTYWIDREGGSISLIKSPLQMFLAVLQLRITNSPFKKLLYPFKPFISLLYKILK